MTGQHLLDTKLGRNVQMFQSEQVDECRLELGDARVLVRVERFGERPRPAKRFELAEQAAVLARASAKALQRKV